ncbi:uncharacterized protein LOC110415739 [Herrania umbratica]|uniref:Uncharacterized protein LOC110415739 n=1 Tax=Herrania umbratica TaxID=108875 RepID=A0A6J1A8E0_9ROSI|nr:uncharacterized protein LOC110415739 [Herrania umbratica]
MKNEGSVEPSYAEFEPYCTWKKERKICISKATDILEIKLSGFKKEEVKVELEKDVLHISGERPVGRSPQRFLKKIDVSKYDTEDLGAEFEGGILRIRLPMKCSAIRFRVGGDNETLGILLSWPQIKTTISAVAAALLLLLLAFYMYKYSECTNF